MGLMAPAGAAAAANAPPTPASDPATLTALLRIRFTGVPFIVVVTGLFRLLAERGAAAVPALACPAGLSPRTAGPAPWPRRGRRSLLVIVSEHAVTACTQQAPWRSSALVISQVGAGPADYCHDRSPELLRAPRPGVPLRSGRHAHRQRVPARHCLARRAVAAGHRPVGLAHPPADRDERRPVRVRADPGGGGDAVRGGGGQ